MTGAWDDPAVRQAVAATMHHGQARVATAEDLLEAVRAAVLAFDHYIDTDELDPLTDAMTELRRELQSAAHR